MAYAKTLFVGRVATALLATLAFAGCSSGRPVAGGTAGQGAAGGGSSAGSGASAANPTGEGTGCTMDGATRSCCTTGTQTCSGTVEFLTWGACLDAKGVKVVCGGGTIPGGCGVGEFGPSCTKLADGGVPHYCGNGEFPPSCVPWTGDGGIPHYCGTGEFPPSCIPKSGDAGVPPTCRPGELGLTCVPPPGNWPDGGRPPLPSLCTDPAINNEPEILQASSPAVGQTVSKNGQIKLWVTDERAPFIAPGEQVDATTGAVTKPGDRTAKAPDGYLYEPALYIAPATAENGGTPHFPQYIKGEYDNLQAVTAGKPVYQALQSAPIDPPPAGASAALKYNAEDIWDVSALGLAPGTYIAEFVIHDGDHDRGVGCVTIVVTP